MLTVKSNQDSKPERILKKLHSLEGIIAKMITGFSGSMNFVYLHVLWFGLWIMINQRAFDPHLKPFDPFPYGLLTMIVSLEAIFLATFIMVEQNRQSLLEEYRELEEDVEEKETEEEVKDIQKDLDDIKNAVTLIQQKISDFDKNKIR